MQQLLLLLVAGLGLGLARASPPLAPASETEHTIEHAVGVDGQWAPRGSFLVALSDKKLSVKMTAPGWTMSAQESAALVEAARKREPYRIRVQAVERTGVPGEGFIVASTSACAVLRDGKELIALQLDKSGAISGLHYERPVGSTCDVAGSNFPADFAHKLETKIAAQVPKEGQQVPVVHYTLAEARGVEGEKDQPQSFMQKYWYLIMPMTLYVLFLQPAPNDAAAATAPRGQAGAKRQAAKQQ